MIIKKAEIDDLEVILHLQKEVFLKEAVLNNDLYIPPMIQTLEELISEYDRYQIIKITRDGEIIGSVRGHIENHIGHISRLMVAEGYQNQGIGSLLMKAIEAKLKEVGKVEKFTLFTGKNSEKSLYLYKKLGYVVYKEEAFEGEADLVYLEKI